MENEKYIRYEILSAQPTTQNIRGENIDGYIVTSHSKIFGM